MFVLFFIEPSALWVKIANSELFLTGRQRSRHLHLSTAKAAALHAVLSIQNIWSNIPTAGREFNVLQSKKTVLRKTAVYGEKE